MSFEASMTFAVGAKFLQVADVANTRTLTRERRGKQPSTKRGGRRGGGERTDDGLCGGGDGDDVAVAVQAPSIRTSPRNFFSLCSRDLHAIRTI